jgi:hypothetical protein
MSANRMPPAPSSTTRPASNGAVRSTSSTALSGDVATRCASASASVTAVSVKKRSGVLASTRRVKTARALLSSSCRTNPGSTASSPRNVSTGAGDDATGTSVSIVSTTTSPSRANAGVNVARDAVGPLLRCPGVTHVCDARSHVPMGQPSSSAHSNTAPSGSDASKHADITDSTGNPRASTPATRTSLRERDRMTMGHSNEKAPISSDLLPLACCLVPLAFARLLPSNRRRRSRGRDARPTLAGAQARVESAARVQRRARPPRRRRRGRPRAQSHARVARRRHRVAVRRRGVRRSAGRQPLATPLPRRTRHTQGQRGSRARSTLPRGRRPPTSLREAGLAPRMRHRSARRLRAAALELPDHEASAPPREKRSTASGSTSSSATAPTSSTRAALARCAPAAGPTSHTFATADEEADFIGTTLRATSARPFLILARTRTLLASLGGRLRARGVTPLMLGDADLMPAGEHVVLATLHRSKGLEAPSVILAGMHESPMRFPGGSDRQSLARPQRAPPRLRRHDPRAR